MNLCIKCGSDVLPIMSNPIDICKFPPIGIVSYQCINPDCELNTTKKDENNWSLEKHKDNQNWAVRHIRALETDNQALKEQIVGLMQQNMDLATKLQYLITNMEQTFNKDLDGDGKIGTL